MPPRLKSGGATSLLPPLGSAVNIKILNSVMLLILNSIDCFPSPDAHGRQFGYYISDTILKRTCRRRLHVIIFTNFV